MSDSTSFNDCAEWIRRFTYASAREGMIFTYIVEENSGFGQMQMYN